MHTHVHMWVLIVGKLNMSQQSPGSLKGQLSWGALGVARAPSSTTVNGRCQGRDKE